MVTAFIQLCPFQPMYSFFSTLTSAQIGRVSSILICGLTFPFNPTSFFMTLLELLALFCHFSYAIPASLMYFYISFCPHLLFITL